MSVSARALRGVMQRHLEQWWRRPGETEPRLIAGRAWVEMQAQLEALRRARQPAGAFLEEHGPELRSVRIGATFSPEHCHDLLSRQGIRDDLARRRRGLAALDLLPEHLGITEIRLPIRWNRAVSPATQRLDMSFYAPYLDALIRRGVGICLNVGPMKAARWPEYHLPEWLPRIARAIPPPGTIVRADSDLARQGRDHLEALLDHLKARYSPGELAHITTIQPENEPFSHFGHHRLFLGPEYMHGLIALIRAHFPAAKLLVNTMGIADARDFRRGVSHLETIARLFAEVVRLDPTSRHRLISGFDYYHFVAGLPELPGLGTPDQVTLLNLRMGDAIERHRALARSVGYEVEVTEGQMEPWGNDLPGNSLHHLQFVLRRCLSLVTPRAASVIRLWGVEGLALALLAGAATPAHRQMGELIAAINAMAGPPPASPP